MPGAAEIAMETFDKIKETISKNKTELSETFKTTSIGLFGPSARGEQKATSDIDLLGEFREAVSLLGVVRAENYLSDILKAKVDLVPKEDMRPELRERILAEVIYL